MLEKFRQISKENVAGKTIVLRVDLNSPVKDGGILISPKMIEHADTIRRLAEKGARLLVLSHQGREGREDFIPLESHRRELELLTEKKVGFAGWKEKDLDGKIKKMKNGDILLFDNTRFLEFEGKELSPTEHAKNSLIKKMAQHADCFVLDALSVAHRSHATVVGFMPLLESFAGPYLVQEIKALERLEKSGRDLTLVLGGMKPEDSLEFAEHMLQKDRVKEVLLGGILGELAILAKGKKLGKKEEFLEKKGLLEEVERLKRLLEEYGESICIPVDLAIERYGRREEISLADLPTSHTLYDIGEITAQNYEHKIHHSSYAVYNGPFGKFEDYQFAYGTRRILSAMTASRGFSLVGGGDTVTALLRLGFKRKEFSHVSLAGKALLEHLSEGKLAALEALAKNGKPGKKK